jgi:hypothetical protein
MTSEVQGAVDNISAATNSCDALGSGGVDLNQVNSYVGQAMGQMDKALQILQGNG